MSKYNKTTQNKIRSLMAETIKYQNQLNWCNDEFAIKAYKTTDPSKPGIYQATPAEAAPLQKAIGTNVADFLKGKLPDEADSWVCLLYTSPSPRDATLSRMPSSA